MVLLATPTRAAEFPTPDLAQVDPAGIRGSLVVCGGGELPEAALQRFLELAGGQEARLVVIPTAAERADGVEPDSYARTWRQRGVPHVAVIHTRDRSVADSESFIAPLKSATAVWFAGGQQTLLANAYIGTQVEKELYALRERGGVIGGTSAGAAIQSQLMIALGNPEATVMRGFDLVPGGVIDQHFKARNRQPRLTAVLAAHPGYFGLGIDERTAVIIRDRRLQVVGASSVTVCLSKSANRPAMQYEISAGQVADLTALRRAAIARAAPAFPAETPVIPHVERGSLMLVGGGQVTDEMRRRFVELAGGPLAQIVVVPTAGENPRVVDHRDVREFQAAGAGTVSVLHTTDRAQADRSEFLEPLRHATGVWFGGGRQWRLVDAYEGTATWQEFHNVLHRGGVIGGSSAGATIQGNYLVRGHPLGNQLMMAEGYERGFAFLPGCAVDQHFTQRGRMPDMDSLKQTFPQLLGIGIDESTALIVQKTTARVIGKHSVYFYDGSPNEDSERRGFTKAAAGEAYDLQRRTRIE